MCPKCNSPLSSIVKSGFYRKKYGSQKRVQRFLCRCCRSKFSEHTGSLTFRERKPHLTQKVLGLLMEGVSQRGIARNLKCSPITVARKLVRLGTKAQLELNSRAEIDVKKAKTPISVVQIDEMETFEHSKYKPLSIALAVDQKSRQILSAEVAIMPCPGPLAEISKQKYGLRPDHRKQAMTKVLTETKRLCPELKLLKSDKCSRYPSCIKSVFGPNMIHLRFKGRRSSPIGQGELKRGGRDPIFSLNHTCAMFRDRIKRLTRRTWTTTKRVDRLAHLVNLYAWWHNQLLSKPKSRIKMPTERNFLVT